MNILKQENRISFHVLESLFNTIQHPNERYLNKYGSTFNIVIITEQKIANPCIPFNPFHTVLLS